MGGSIRACVRSRLLPETPPAEPEQAPGASPLDDALFSDLLQSNPDIMGLLEDPEDWPEDGEDALPDDQIPEPAVGAGFAVPRKPSPAEMAVDRSRDGAPADSGRRGIMENRALGPPSGAASLGCFPNFFERSRCLAQLDFL